MRVVLCKRDGSNLAVIELHSDRCCLLGVTLLIASGYPDDRRKVTVMNPDLPIVSREEHAIACMRRYAITHRDGSFAEFASAKTYLLTEPIKRESLVVSR